jgi:hypothetical protein
LQKIGWNRHQKWRAFNVNNNELPHGEVAKWRLSKSSSSLPTSLVAGKSRNNNDHNNTAWILLSSSTPKYMLDQGPAFPPLAALASSLSAVLSALKTSAGWQ